MCLSFLCVGRRGPIVGRMLFSLPAMTKTGIPAWEYVL